MMKSPSCMTVLLQVKPHPNLEVEAWTDLASIYTKLGLQMDSNSCLEIAKSIGYFSQKTWHTKGE